MTSIIIPVYNSKPTLRRCIDSVKNQTSKDWECIIVDDGSTDDSRAELDRLTWQDERFTLVLCDNNQGLSNALNSGIMYARGENLFFLDSDDYIEPDALEYLQQASQAMPRAGVIYTPKIYYLDRFHVKVKQQLDNVGFHKWDSPVLFSDKNTDVGYITGQLYVKKNLPCEMYIPRVKVHMDMLCNMRLLMAGTSFFITDRYLYHYIRRDDSLLHTPLSIEDVNSIRRALVTIAKEYKPTDKMFERFSAFLESALAARNKVE